MSIAEKLKGLKAQVGISYFFLNIISISLFSWVISINQLELISENSRYQAKELISSVVSSLHKMPVPPSSKNRTSSVSITNLKKLSETLSPLIPNHFLFQDSNVLIVAGKSLPLPKDFREQAIKAVALERNSGVEYNLTLNEARSGLDVYVALGGIGLEGITLYTSISLSGISQRYRDLYKQIAMTVVGLTILHFLFGLFLFRRIVTPILSLKNATKQIASGNYETRISSYRKDEIGLLADGFNHMSETIQQAFTRLSQQMEELQVAHGKIEKMATTDELTGLFNRRHFFDVLRKQIAHAFRHTRPLSLVLMDIDHFKNINDRFGHVFGDKVLRETGALITKVVRESDILARYGGEEIVFIFPESDQNSAEQAADKVRAAIESYRFLLPDGTAVPVTASFGVAEIHLSLTNAITDAADIQVAFIECADKALYRAKHEGRNRVVVFDPEAP